MWKKSTQTLQETQTQVLLTSFWHVDSHSTFPSPPFLLLAVPRHSLLFCLTSSLEITHQESPIPTMISTGKSMLPTRSNSCVSYSPTNHTVGTLPSLPNTTLGDPHSQTKHRQHSYYKPKSHFRVELFPQYSGFICMVIFKIFAKSVFKQGYRSEFIPLEILTTPLTPWSVFQHKVWLLPLEMFAASWVP